MFINKYYYFNKINIINILIALIPLSLILGNLATNFNILLIIFFGAIIYKNNLFNNNLNKYNFLFYLFFVLLIIITIQKNTQILTSSNIDIKKQIIDHIIKSIFFLRYLILFLIINKLLEENKFNIKLFFFSCIIMSALISGSVFFEFILNNFFKNQNLEIQNYSGFLGKEKIAGGYIQKFSLFSIFLYCFLYLKKKIKSLIFLYLLLSFFLFTIILSGNRMPLLIFLSTFIFFLMVEKKFKELLTFILLCTLLIFSVIKYPIINNLDLRLKNFVSGSIELFIKAPKLFYANNYNNEKIDLGRTGYLTHFNSGIQTWKKNKIFGGGLKSFRINCTYAKNQTCNTHPHNYFIEILIDTGLVGLILIYSFIIYLFFLILKDPNKIFKQRSRYILYPFFFIIFFEFFPFRSTGSFFTTGNASTIFLMLPMIVNYNKLSYNSKNDQKKNN